MTNMNKTATVDHPVLPIIADRWSPRSFLDRPVPADAFLSVLEAARWAPSSFNEQPWRLVVTQRGTDPHARLFAALGESNRKWAGSAPILGLSVAKLVF